MKPPVPYFGGKITLGPAIAAMLPAHGHYVEPFCGSLAVLLAKPPSAHETVNDLDGELMCVGSQTRILTADLRWARAGDVQVGDQLVGFDETNGPTLPGLRAPSQYRRWRRTEVEAVTRIRKPSYRLVFDDGTEVVASEDHMWLGGSHRVGGRGWRWQTTRGLVCNRKDQRSWLLKLTDVVEPEETWEAGWLAGFFDGEGNIISAGVRKAGWRVSVAQKLGPEADLCEYLLKERGFDVRKSLRTHSNGWKDVVAMYLGGGMPEVLRFLMLTRPQRLISNFVNDCLPHASLYSRSRQAVGLAVKEFLGEQEVMAIQTSSRTYVAEGLASHNCFWRVLRERPADLARVCALTPHSRAEHAAAYEPADDKLETARRVFVRLTQGRAGQLRRTGWRHYINPAGSWASMPGYLAGYVDRIAPAAERLARVSLECLPALEIIAKYGSEPDVLLYVDPPYLGTARALQRDRGRYDRYRIDMPSEAEHRELAEALRAAAAAVVLSGYASDLYDRELYPGWDRHTMASGTGQGDGWGNRTEVLWSNRPLRVTPSLFDAVGGAA